ncbi:VirB3 family type IV secretion system protein [Massilia sp. CCM 9210]|uniref:VirB3 family type IV secretion system protein n=1 Tax=Massilia scottii TaxID=3057166 RepID=UPI0027969F3C|nr:VirB3 family type IV secretion system protein [Massilia sp. CCM 9210]MDQ1817819.1 VirB3 family type IV secretion system protein [Massilia sp. CCM 9210]
MEPDEEIEPEIYISYNGLGRSPVIWGVPYMFILFVGSGALLAGMMCGLFFGPLGWLVGLVAVPVLIFVRIISENDDKAVNILLIEIKWVLRKKFSGSAKYFGGTTAIAPITYGRRRKDVKQYFKEHIGR